MKSLKGSIILGFVLGIFVPTIGYFFGLWYCNIISTGELISMFVSPKPWMLFVGLFYPLLCLILNVKLNTISRYLKNPEQGNLEKVQKTIAFLPRFYIVQVTVYATLGATAALVPEHFIDRTGLVFAEMLAVAWPYLWTIPFFVYTTMLIEKWAQGIPLSQEHKFMSIRTKLFINIFATTLGTAAIFVILNISVTRFVLGTGKSSFDYLLGILVQKNLVTGGIGMVSILANLFMLSKQIIGPVKETTKMFKEVSQGDLTQRIDIPSRDEIGELKNWCDIFVDKIQDVVAKVKGNAEQVDLSAHQLVASIDSIAVSMRDLNGTGDEIASSAGNTSTTMVEITSVIQQMDDTLNQVVQNSNDASRQGRRTVDIAKQGKVTVEHTVSEMDDIQAAMANIVDSIEALGNSAKEIEKIVEVIGAIAKNTNLLSLNASIEAARAGENGRGFAVVAESISKLADNSSEATRDITKLIKEVQKIVANAIDKMNDGARKVEKGVGLVRNTGDAFEEIFEAIEDTTKFVGGIAVALERQSKESKQIMRSINTVNDMSMHVSASVEEQVAAIEEIMSDLEKVNSLPGGAARPTDDHSDTTAKRLELQAKGLFKLVSGFKV